MRTDDIGYWYRNQKLIKLISGIHINDLISNPSTFGIAKKKIEAIYKKYNEPVGFEGKAREEIMIEAMKKGWIRVRKFKSSGGIGWIFQFDDFDKRKKDLKSIVKRLCDDKEMKESDQLYILSYDGKTRQKYDSFEGKPIRTFYEQEESELLIIERMTSYLCFDY